MREAGRTSWEIGFDQPEPLVIGLFVRDVAGLRSRHTWLPHCAPGKLDPHHVLLTDELLSDSDEYRGRITPVLQALL